MAAPLLDGRVFIPGEILEDIAFALLAASPLQSPAPIIPLLQTSRAFLLILSPRSSTTLYARLCRLKFDLGATERRSTSPNNRKLTELFVRMSTSLRCIRRGDIFAEDLTNTMLDMFFMVMHNDGKNLAQLDNVGAVEFLDKFIRLRLHEGKESNDMWPLENTRNSAALWLSWFFTTTGALWIHLADFNDVETHSSDQLEKESLQQKNQLIDLILPYILCPHRVSAVLKAMRVQPLISTAVRFCVCTSQSFCSPASTALSKSENGAWSVPRVSHRQPGTALFPSVSVRNHDPTSSHLGSGETSVLVST